MHYLITGNAVLYVLFSMFALDSSDCQVFIVCVLFDYTGYIDGQVKMNCTGVIEDYLSLSEMSIIVCTDYINYNILAGRGRGKM